MWSRHLFFVILFFTLHPERFPRKQTYGIVCVFWDGRCGQSDSFCLDVYVRICTCLSTLYIQMSTCFKKINNSTNKRTNKFCFFLCLYVRLFVRLYVRRYRVTPFHAVATPLCVVMCRRLHEREQLTRSGARSSSLSTLQVSVNMCNFLCTF